MVFVAVTVLLVSSVKSTEISRCLPLQATEDSTETLRFFLPIFTFLFLLEIVEDTLDTETSSPTLCRRLDGTSNCKEALLMPPSFTFLNGALIACPTASGQSEPSTTTPGPPSRRSANPLPRL